MSDKDLRNGLLSITRNCTRRDRIDCHESQPELRFRFKRLEEFIHKQTDLLFSICWRHFTTHLTGFISCLMETKLLGNVCWNNINRWKTQSSGLWLNSTRLSTMTRINKNSYGCNADSLCSICSPSATMLTYGQQTWYLMKYNSE